LLKLIPALVIISPFLKRLAFCQFINKKLLTIH
jgi:hypothetical protein